MINVKCHSRIYHCIVYRITSQQLSVYVDTHTHTEIERERDRQTDRQTDVII